MTDKAGVGELRGSASSVELLARARRGDRRAISALFSRQGNALRRWATGRLPKWARSMTDTADIVQDVLLQTFRRIDKFEDRGKGALQAYLRRGVVNRIHDEMRRVSRHPTDALDEDVVDLPHTEPSPFDIALTAQQEQRYKAALATLSEEDQILVVGRMELLYNYAQLALISGRATPEAARLAVRRAIIKLAERMSGA